MIAVPLLNDRMALGESIVWDDAEGTLLWVDVGYPSYLYRYDLAQGVVRRTEYPGALCGVNLTNRPDTVLVLADNCLKLCHLPTERFELLVTVEPDRPWNLCNDCGVDALGRLWVGTMHNNLRPDPSGSEWRRDGSLYCLDKGKLTQHESGLGIPNTLLWAPDGKHFYLADSVEGKIFGYDFDGENISGKRVFGDSTAEGVPDGSTIDDAGNLWNARWGDAAIFVYSPKGTRIRTVPIPASQVTSCTFGGPEMKTLYVTTAQHELTPAEKEKFPLAGCVFKIETAVCGKTRGRVKL